MHAVFITYTSSVDRADLREPYTQYAQTLDDGRIEHPDRTLRGQRGAEWPDAWACRGRERGHIGQASMAALPRRGGRQGRRLSR